MQLLLVPSLNLSLLIVIITFSSTILPTHRWYCLPHKNGGYPCRWKMGPILGGWSSNPVTKFTTTMHGARGEFGNNDDILAFYWKPGANLNLSSTHEDDMVWTGASEISGNLPPFLKSSRSLSKWPPTFKLRRDHSKEAALNRRDCDKRCKMGFTISHLYNCGTRLVLLLPTALVQDFTTYHW